MTVTDIVADAAAYAARLHVHQEYGDGVPYIVHPAEVIAVLKAFGFGDDEALLAAAWLHDGPEDGEEEVETALKDLYDMFGEEVAGPVDAVTVRPHWGHNRKTRNEEAYVHIAVSVRATALKLADRIANVQNCWRTHDTRLFMYKREYPAFRKALYVEGRLKLAPMWSLLDDMLGYYVHPGGRA